MSLTRFRSQWRNYAQTIALVAAATLLGLPLRSSIEPTNLVMLYLLAVVIAAIGLGRGPAILTSLLSVLAFDLVFVPPYAELGVADAQYLLTFAGLMGVGLVISTLAVRARQQAEAAERREAQTVVLYELSHDLAGAANLEQVAQTVVRHVEQTVESHAAVLTSRHGEPLAMTAATAGYKFDDDEKATARWAFHKAMAIRHKTAARDGAHGVYLPLKTANKVVGVLGVMPPARTGRGEPFSGERWRLLESFASQAALAVERSLFAEEARQAHLLQETEKLQTALLNSISHDLRTPLASITGALSSLEDDAALLSAGARLELIRTALEEAQRLNRLVGNLLKMTQLESGALQVGKEPHSVEDVIGVALAQLEHRLDERAVDVDVPEGLPLAPMDFVLIVQVLTNLMENADKFSPPGSRLQIRARTSAGDLLVDVLDRGPGIPQQELERIFDKFYRVRAGGAGGTGLGLSISRGIIEAHGGRISAQNREGGGSVFTVALPLEASAKHEAAAET